MLLKLLYFLSLHVYGVYMQDPIAEMLLVFLAPILRLGIFGRSIEKYMKGSLEIIEKKN